MTALDHPKAAIIAFTAVCLLAFWITIPLPRIDGQLVGSDGINYFAYLPSLVFDRDLDFRNQLEQLLSDQPDHLMARTSTMPPDAPIGNPHGIGLSLLWAPFYFIAITLAELLNRLGIYVAQDGHGTFHQAIVLSGSILYGGFGLWFTYLFTIHFASNRWALFATLLIAAAGNIVYYMTAEPSMSHTVSLFLTSLFFLTWIQLRGDGRVIAAALLGLLGGLMALVRPQDGLMLLLPFLAAIPGAWHSAVQSDYRPFRELVRNAFVAASVAGLIFSIQLVAWNVMYGSHTHNPYSNAGDFFWLHPRLLDVLFSARRGMFIWHPVFLFAITGLVCTFRIDKTIAIVGAFGILMQVYLVGSWSWWWQGSAFGARMLIVCTPIFALGLASLLDCVSQRLSWKHVFAGAALLLVWNFLLFVEYRFWLVYKEMESPATWYDVTITRITFLIDRIR